MFKLLIVTTCLLVITIAQDTILCSGYIKINKNDLERITIDQIDGQLLNKDEKVIETIQISANGFYTVEITELESYQIKFQSKNNDFEAMPKSFALNFKTKTFDEAKQMCQKQNNIQIKEIYHNTVQSTQNEQEIKTESIEIEHIAHQYKIKGLIGFEGDFTKEEQKLYQIKSIQVLNEHEEQVQGRSLTFMKYFEFESAVITDLKIIINVEKQKEKGEQSAKQIVFEENIAKSQIQSTKLQNELHLKIKRESFGKEENKISQVITPLVIFLLVLGIFNYDKIQKRF